MFGLDSSSSSHTLLDGHIFGSGRFLCVRREIFTQKTLCINAILTYPVISDVFSSYCVLQITRLVHALSPRSLVPMYLSFFPYIVFQFLSREAHSVFSILWYISVMALTLQLGSDQLRSHIVFSVLTFVGKGVFEPLFYQKFD